MKTSHSSLLILLTFLFTFSKAANFINAGVKIEYTLNAGDTLRVTGGKYNGKIKLFSAGSVIIVSSSATFDPEAIATPAGKIINYGVSTFGSLGTYSGFRFENYNVLIVSGNLSLYDGATQIWNNNIAASMKITGDLTMSNAEFTNYSTMTVGGKVAMYANTSELTNKGSLTIGKDLAMSDGVLANFNKISVDDFNAWGGKVINEGSINPEGTMVFSAGSSYVNKCLLVTEKGFTNYGNFTNNGMLWVGTTNSAADHFINSGTFTNAPDAVVKTLKFTNYSTINGGGNYYINGDSYSSGVVGVSGTTTDTIKVYDLSRASTSRIFDVQWGTVYNNVVFRPFAQPDTNKVNYAGCSQYYKLNIGSTLPVEWNSFDVKLMQNQAAITWSAEYDANVKFDVEKSTDKVNFKSIATASSSTTKNYTHTDANVEKNTVVYYRIKATNTLNGAFKYTDTKSLKIAGTVGSLSVYPNPTKDVATVQYKSDKVEALTIRISNATGVQLLMKNVTATKGINAFSLTETAQFKAGIYFAELINSNEVIASVRIIKN